MPEAPLILLSNDDGVAAPGLMALHAALGPVGEVHIVAPEREQSANSHSLTLHRPLRHRRVEPRIHAIDGTPADCVYVALYYEGMLPRRPSLVLSGINVGPNLGSDIHYSGTVAAAREGALRGIPSIALSMCDGADLGLAAGTARDMASRLLSARPPDGPAPLLNVNFPAGTPRGVRVTSLGRRMYHDEVIARLDPRGREYFWLGGPGHGNELLEGSDTEAIEHGYVAVTALLTDVTHGGHFELATWVARAEER